MLSLDTPGALKLLVPLPERWMRGLGQPLLPGSQITIHHDGAGALEEVMAALDRARDHVNLDMARGTPLGEEVARRVAELGRAGVTVNVLGHGAPRRALLVVDGRTAFIGQCDAAHTLLVQVQGPAVQRLQRLFIAQWQRRARGLLSAAARYFPPLAPAGGDPIALFLQGHPGDDSARPVAAGDAVRYAIDSAHTSVLVRVAHAAPSSAWCSALERAAQRGVAVELVHSPCAPHWASLPWPSHRRLARLARAGVRLHPRSGDSAPLEGWVVDDSLCGIGIGDTITPASQSHLVLTGAAHATTLIQLLLRDARAGPPAGKASSALRAPECERFGAAERAHG
jgi:hypothetical protein